MFKVPNQGTTLNVIFFFFILKLLKGMIPWPFTPNIVIGNAIYLYGNANKLLLLLCCVGN